MNNLIIRVSHLSHTYSNGPLLKQALRDINLEISKGECVAIIGSNGSGKSTLVQHFNGLLRPTSGSVIVEGIKVEARGGDLRLLRQRVGLLFQFPEAQLFEQTVFADVAFGPRRMHLGRAEVRSRVLSALEIVGLPFHEYGLRSPYDLSGGQRRRIALAGVISMRPSVLILDEPSAGLDLESRTELYLHLQRLRRETNITIILVSHDMSEVAAMADRILVMHQGALVMQDMPAHIFSQGYRLKEYGLALPALHELLAVLRQKGMSIPEDIVTLDDAFAHVQSQTGSFRTVSLEAEADHSFPNGN